MSLAVLAIKIALTVLNVMNLQLTGFRQRYEK
jgi:hypothetical protein